MIKVAGAADLPRVQSIMEQIRSEDPSYWPYGLRTDQFNGGLYMVQKEANEQPVGFVGWQKFPEGHRTVGYYAIGILPEHRGQSFAKQAVLKVMREMGDSCDEIRALVMDHNEPSKALARSVGVTPILEKSASTAKQLATILGTGLGSTVFFDQAADPDRTLSSSLQPWTWDKNRMLMGGLNALLGGVGGQRLTKGEVGQGLTSIALAPTKDLAMKGVGSLHKIDEAAKKFSESEADGRRIPGEVWLGAGGLGLGALALLAYNAKRKADYNDAMLAEQAKGRVRITLPTSQAGDNETQVELPFEELNLSKALRGRLGRDTKRRLYAETRQRTRRRPRPGSATDEENKLLAKEMEEMDKEASTEGLASLVREIEFYKQAVGSAGPVSAGSVPSPPSTGQNPALRMNQQDQAVARAIQPAPDANPQIMEAQQAAAAAEQAGAQQAAQIEQAAQQAQMEQQAQFQQALMKSEQEKEVLKLQLEKEKALKDLNGAQAKAEASRKTGEGTEAQRLVSNRIARLEQRVKVAGLIEGTAYGVPMKSINSVRIPAGARDTALESQLFNRPEPATPPPTSPARVTGPSPGARTPVAAPVATANPVPPDTPGVLSASTGQRVQASPPHLKSYALDRINDSPDAAGLIPRIGVYRHSYGPILDAAYGLFRSRLLTPTPPPRAAITQTDILNSPDRIGLINQLLSQSGMMSVS